jgi:hypothetical protein
VFFYFILFFFAPDYPFGIFKLFLVMIFLIGHAIMDDDACIMHIAKTEDEHKEMVYK